MSRFLDWFNGVEPPKPEVPKARPTRRGDMRITVEEKKPGEWVAYLEKYEYSRYYLDPTWIYEKAFTGGDEQEVLTKAGEHVAELKAAKERRDAIYSIPVTL